MRRDGDEARLFHMLEASRKIARLTKGKPRSILDTDDTLIDVLAWLFLVIGEAANHISASFQRDHPEFRWRAIIGVRNRIAHGYDDIDKDIMWGLIGRDIPELIRKLEELGLSFEAPED